MFVRTKKGKIFDCNVGELMGKPIYYPKTSKTNGCIDWSEVHKKSENIIDILEVGDYVNGYLVIEKPYTYHDIQFVSVDTQDSWSWGKGEMPVENIKSIVTKEKFESMSYKVGK